ncbi:hypothetical protein HHL26_06990 [Sphingobium sp. TB-6]|uniref:hypothetical protein n=1 Tax=Sphingobium sp. TB-6 TaxID=2728850 RepID=UPI00146AE01C|nr:hypothetical protein [Sphingobium sp. TB-6]NML88813.1 hypothetical protein [Sphingobium sp. TB-6]
MSGVSITPPQDPTRFCYGGRLLNIPISSDGSSWPVASDEYLYCWQALIEVGKALYGDEWSFYDLLAMVPQRPPGMVRAEARSPVKEDDAFWDREAKKWQGNWNAHKRVSAAIEWFGDELRNSRVAAFTLKSGRMLKVEQGYWFGKAAHDAAFSAGQIGGYFLFIGRDELMARLALIREPEIAVPSTAEGLHLSPYMKLMLAIVENSKINPDNQPSIDSLKAEVAQLAPNFGLQVNPYYADRDRPEYKAWSPDKGYAELSGKMLDAIPSLVREIPSQVRRG